VEEDLLYAYGFVARDVWRLLHPRKVKRMTALEKRVLAVVTGPMHPTELEAHFGRRRVVNAWGGYSQATKRALEHLHHRGLLRIARRENGIRVYEPAPPIADRLSPDERLRELVMVVVGLLAPVQKRTLSSIASYLRRKIPAGEPIRALLATGALREDVVDGVTYLQPPSEKCDILSQARFLAPFDPVVWDRRRFEHLWQWQYRFEAYTPKSKRVRGYYSLPLLWRDRVIGWANIAEDVELGFVNGRPREREFSRALDAEVARMREFLR
jgi:hypothetical protein